MILKEMTFLKAHQQGMEVLGFWTETFKRTLIQSHELLYATEVLREWGVEDIIINNDQVLVKWRKRLKPLTDKQLKQEYGR